MTRRERDGDLEPADWSKQHSSHIQSHVSMTNNHCHLPGQIGIQLSHITDNYVILQHFVTPVYVLVGHCTIQQKNGQNRHQVCPVKLKFKSLYSLRKYAFNMTSPGIPNSLSSSAPYALARDHIRGVSR